MLLITTFVELCMVARRSWTQTGPTGHLLTDVLCRGLEKNGMVRAWQENGMASVNQTQPHCVNQMGKTQSKPLTAQHGRGTAWAWHAMCESASNWPSLLGSLTLIRRQYGPSYSTMTHQQTKLWTTVLKTITTTKVYPKVPGQCS